MFFLMFFSLNLLDPNEIYRNPVTSSQEYGWWRQDGAPESLPWTKVPRSSARVNSEMTRYNTLYNFAFIFGKNEMKSFL